MFGYRRKDSSAQPPQKTVSIPALVTLCNYSYDPSRHIDTQTLRKILTTYSPKYTYLYLRIFNEASPRMIASFIHHVRLDPDNIRAIYERLRQREFALRPLDELLSYI